MSASVLWQIWGANTTGKIKYLRFNLVLTDEVVSKYSFSHNCLVFCPDSQKIESCRIINEGRRGKILKIGTKDVTKVTGSLICLARGWRRSFNSTFSFLIPAAHVALKDDTR